MTELNEIYDDVLVRTEMFFSNENKTILLESRHKLEHIIETCIEEGTAASMKVAADTIFKYLALFVKEETVEKIKEYELRFNYIQTPDFWMHALAEAAKEFDSGIISIDEYQEKTKHFLTLEKKE